MPRQLRLRLTFEPHDTTLNIPWKRASWRNKAYSISSGSDLVPEQAAHVASEMKITTTRAKNFQITNLMHDYISKISLPNNNVQ
jgi:hypothetical protein